MRGAIFLTLSVLAFSTASDFPIVFLGYDLNPEFGRIDIAITSDSCYFIDIK